MADTTWAGYQFPKTIGARVVTGFEDLLFYSVHRAYLEGFLAAGGDEQAYREAWIASKSRAGLYGRDDG